MIFALEVDVSGPAALPLRDVAYLRRVLKAHLKAGNVMSDGERVAERENRVSGATPYAPAECGLRLARHGERTHGSFRENS